MLGVAKGVAVATIQQGPQRVEIPEPCMVATVRPESQPGCPVGLANRCLQPLGHLSAGRVPYKTQAGPSNRRGESGESPESGESAQTPKVVTVTAPVIPLFDWNFGRVPAPGPWRITAAPPRPQRTRESTKVVTAKRAVRR